MNNWLKWVLIVVGILVVLIVAFFIVGNFKSKNIDENNLPKFIQADFIDLDQIYTISKFRSGSGHDFNDGTETCRSMKHYFNVQVSAEYMREMEENNGWPKPPTPGRSIDIFAPVDGKITNIVSENVPLGKQIYIKPDSASDFTVRLFHIYPLSGIEKGTTVKAGQKIGEIGINQNTDIAIEASMGLSRRFFSYFQVMPDEIFANYIARGAKDRSDFITTKAERDARPLECNGEQFAKNNDGDASSEHFVRLSGWKNGY